MRHIRLLHILNCHFELFYDHNLLTALTQLNLKLAHYGNNCYPAAHYNACCGICCKYDVCNIVIFNRMVFILLSVKIPSKCVATVSSLIIRRISAVKWLKTLPFEKVDWLQEESYRSFLPPQEKFRGYFIIFNSKKLVSNMLEISHCYFRKSSLGSLLVLINEMKI